MRCHCPRHRSAQGRAAHKQCATSRPQGHEVGAPAERGAARLLNVARWWRGLRGAFLLPRAVE
eukprot:6157805-Pyramimonas_sp.AAC.1